MQLVVYSVLMLIAIAFVGYGLFHQDAMYAIIGFSFLFILGIVLGQVLGGAGLEVENGLNVTTVNDSFITVSYTHASVSDSNTLWIGRFIAIGSAFGLTSVFFMLKSFYGRKNDE